MKITKFGHCCLLIEEGGLRILTDPGYYSEGQNKVENIDIVLITHEHQDHLHVDSLKKILENNPVAKVFTNKGVGKFLDGQNISYSLLENGQTITEQGIEIEGFGEKHELMYSGLPQVDNVGYMVDGKFFYPGDAFTNPNKKVDLLALPVSAPWLKIGEVIDYAKLLKPNVCFPVHDASSTNPLTAYRPCSTILEPLGIKFIPLEIEKPTDFE